MQVDSSYMVNVYKDVQVSVSKKQENKEKLSAKDITDSYLAQYQFDIFNKSKDEISKQFETFSLADIGYDGKPIGDLSQDEAKKLVSEDGFFGIKKTSDRIANFVLNGAGDDVEKLKSGREGILRGFSEAEELWGKKLPDISYETINKSVEMIDKKLAELGATILDENV
ncbi:hydrogenase-4 component G [Sulfurospirillum sp. 1307]